MKHIVESILSGHLLLFLVRAHRCGSLFELLAHLTLSTQWLTQEAAQEDHDCLQGSWRPITRLSVPTFCPKVAACGTALRRHRSTDTLRLSPARPHSRHLSCHDLSLSVGCHWNTRCLLGHFSDMLFGASLAARSSNPLSSRALRINCTFVTGFCRT